MDAVMNRISAGLTREKVKYTLEDLIDKVKSVAVLDAVAKKVNALCTSSWETVAHAVLVGLHCTDPNLHDANGVLKAAKNNSDVSRDLNVALKQSVEGVFFLAGHYPRVHQKQCVRCAASAASVDGAAEGQRRVRILDHVNTQRANAA
jgi:hypothetical protein